MVRLAPQIPWIPSQDQAQPQVQVQVPHQVQQELGIAAMLLQGPRSSRVIREIALLILGVGQVKIIARMSAMGFGVQIRRRPRPRRRQRHQRRHRHLHLHQRQSLQIALGEAFQVALTCALVTMRISSKHA